MKQKKLRVDIISVIPEVCTPYTDASILGRAKKSRLLEVHVHQLRDFTIDRQKHVDDKPFGGGPGMVMMVQPFDAAVKFVKTKNKKARVILTSAKGKFFTQQDAKRLSKYEGLVFLCGRYEGVDERVSELLADEELSIGPYVVTGGELPALVMLDAIIRLRPGVLGDAESLVNESWNDGETVEYPHYTRPAEYKGSKVPAVLLSGDHKKIALWRNKK